MMQTSIYMIIFYSIISPLTFGNEITDKCRKHKYADGKIVFCAKVAQKEYNKKAEEYYITTDYQISDSTFFGFVTDKYDGAQIAEGQPVILERAYYDPKIYSEVNFAPSSEELEAVRQPTVEKGGRRSTLISYMDTAFFNHNMKFVCQYCGFYVVYKAANKGFTDDRMLRYKVVGRANNPLIFLYNPSTVDDRFFLDTLLFRCNVDTCLPRNLTCLAIDKQTRQNYAKITDYGYLFREGLFSRQEYERIYPQIKEYTTVLKP